MQFKETNPIYVQIAERLCDEILAGRYEADSRVPSVREYSALLEVNVNTTVKSYDQLAARGILYNRRGMGYFVAPDAADLILAARRRAFRDDYLPDLFRRMRQLGIGMDEVAEAYASEK
ncbi:MAG: GntR family transcriptional regulator [Alloprevotella sp.]|nr:GntR family transcriptional regulator [Alloprevotella sp.]